MRTRLLTLLAVVMLATTTRAGISYSTFANSGLIPDGSVVGSAGTASVSGYGSSLTDISVTLNISGGYNGDLYAYLSYGGVLVPLLNRVGVTATGGGNVFGYGDTGFDVTLSSAGANNIHFYGSSSPSFNGSGQLTGTWQPDGRAIDPLSTPGSFDSATPVTFASFDSKNPNGTWTLFLADLSSGGQSQLVSWELDITAVPEPVNVALGAFGVIFVMAGVGRSQAARRLVRRACAR